MRRDISISIAPEADKIKETAKFSLHFAEQATAIVLDVNATALLKVSRAVPDLAQDFLCIASCIYAADKAISRNDFEDKWTRHIGIEVPVEHFATWSQVADDLSDCIGFLTGDLWEISFRHGEKRLIQKKARKRSIRFKRASGEAVCLFSGGLDSFIGSVDWLVENPDERLLLVGHYDRHVSGPGADQRAVGDACRRKFPNRFELSQTQIGLSSGGGADTNFRSRSLLFIALGCYFAEVLGEDTPVLVPENGPIALNFPLTSARRGSCSTRTVHPHFLATLEDILKRVGIANRIHNPYRLKTKGEMVAGCRDQSLLKIAASLTRSCAKANHRENWINIKTEPFGKAPLGCGVCVPCLFRRAGLFARDLDLETYGIPAESINNFQGDGRADMLALVAFLRTGHSDRQIAAGLLANGGLPIEELTSYVDLVKRMRSEVVRWLHAKGSTFLKNQLRAC